jgi:cell division FtsZ-interacting protein ZapD
MGKRLLRATILRPLVDAEALEARYEAVGEAHGTWCNARRFGAHLRGFWIWSGCWRG